MSRNEKIFWAVVITPTVIGFIYVVVDMFFILAGMK